MLSSKKIIMSVEELTENLNRIDINENEEIQGNEQNNFVPRKLDMKNLREDRQKENNKLVRDCIKNNVPRKELKKVCNEKELDRLLKDLSEVQDDKDKDMYEYFFDKCNEDIEYLYSVAPRIAILSSRQCSKDETTVFKACNETISKFEVKIEKLANTELRPHKFSNKLISKDEYKNGKGNYKKNDCLKSLDAKISGKKSGYITAKNTFTEGGHQDNVFDEVHNFGDWAAKYGDLDKLYIILIDTDLEKEFKELSEKFKDNSNIYVVDHVGLQYLLIK